MARGHALLEMPVVCLGSRLILTGPTQLDFDVHAHPLFRVYEARRSAGRRKISLYLNHEQTCH